VVFGEVGIIFFPVMDVRLTDSRITTDELACLTQLRDPYRLVLSQSNVDDTFLPHLKKLMKFDYIYIENTNLTDNAVKELEGTLLDSVIVH